MKIKDCMCGEVCCVKPETKVYEIAKLMNENHIGCVPVCNQNNCIVGVITDRDIILRSVACDKDVKNTPASEIMTCNVCTCTQNDDINEAERKMAKNQIRRIPVVDNNKVIGILTLGDLTHYNGEETGEAKFCNTVEDICGCGGQTKNNY
ncbi:MAG: CBS domain-containing protein [Clostridia bacterium]